MKRSQCNYICIIQHFNSAPRVYIGYIMYVDIIRQCICHLAISQQLLQSEISFIHTFIHTYGPVPPFLFSLISFFFFQSPPAPSAFAEGINS